MRTIIILIITVLLYSCSASRTTSDSSVLSQSSVDSVAIGRHIDISSWRDSLRAHSSVTIDSLIVIDQNTDSTGHKRLRVFAINRISIGRGISSGSSTDVTSFAADSVAVKAAHTDVVLSSATSSRKPGYTPPLLLYFLVIVASCAVAWHISRNLLRRNC